MLPASHCQKCGAAFPPPPENGGGTGYAFTSDGLQICYPCSESMERDVFAKATAEFGAYVSTDGAHLTTWTGAALAKTVGRSSFVNNWGARIFCWRFESAGRFWHGRNAGPGMCVRVRPCK